MVEFVGAADPVTPFSVTARPNSALGKSGLLISMAILLPACSITGLIFLLIGAWPVTLFLSLHILAVLAAFMYVERHTSDFESLTLRDDRLIVDRHTLAGDQHLEFNGYWVQVDLHTSAIGSNTLCLRSHGKEIPIGSLMSDDERLAVSKELGRRLARLRH
ncbi:MAG: hypothetical protein CVU18_17565 [Betaproteobacteria bacterium HGW-Betaproteobacteria-12]|nr:MAG: hypothetical protein CVU18_17565 [Betaproteobacteria bacterium HGW-Betaproteobacteria-12]